MSFLLLVDASAVDFGNDTRGFFDLSAGNFSQYMMYSSEGWK